jgi:hypothetical protein
MTIRDILDYIRTDHLYLYAIIDRAKAFPTACLENEDARRKDSWSSAYRAR